MRHAPRRLRPQMTDRPNPSAVYSHGREAAAVLTPGAGWMRLSMPVGGFAPRRGIHLRSATLVRLARLPLVLALVLVACDSPSDFDSATEVGQPPSPTTQNREEPEPIDQESLLLEFGAVLATAAGAGVAYLRVVLRTTAAEGFDEDCAPLWAHELLEVAEADSSVAITPPGILISGVEVPAEVRFARAVHLGGECAGPLPEPDSSASRPSADEAQAEAGPPASASEPDPDPPAETADETEDDLPVAEPRAPEPQVDPEEPEPQVSGSVDARGNRLPEGMILPEAYEVLYECRWTPAGTLAYEWSIFVRGGAQYQFAAHDVGSGDLQWQYWSSPREGSRIDAQGLDLAAASRQSLLLPQPSQLRFFHATSSIPDDSADYWVDISHLQRQIDYSRLACTGVDPR